MLTSVTRHIRSILYFDALTDEELIRIEAGSTLHSYTAGDIIFLEGNAAAGLWLILYASSHRVIDIH